MNQPPVPPPPPAPKSGFPTWAIVLIVVGLGGPIFLGIFASLAIYGVRKYIANAKTAEARNSLRQLGKDAQTAFERDHKVCKSASRPVPASVSAVRAQKYMASEADWNADQARHAGFACLGFRLAAPQYYQYMYTASPDGRIEITAHGDLNGDGILSTFLLRGEVQGGSLLIAPTLEETNPEE